MKDFFRIKSISQLHTYFGYGPPLHPLISVVDFATATFDEEVFTEKTIINDFYVLSFKRTSQNSLLYGRNLYDFQEGSLMFMAPAQVYKVVGGIEDESDGWGLYFHPDLIVGTSLHKKMDSYTFFHYSLNEALHLSDKERLMIEAIMDNIRTEYDNNLDQHSRNLMVSNLELLFKYCQRFYDRQFLTRTHQNKDVIDRFEELLKGYFSEGKQAESGLVNLDYFAEELSLSKSYLSDLVKKQTGKTIKETVHLHLIDLAKDMLLSSNKSVGEVAYDLGFEYPQYFSRLFKAKVGISPNQYRTMN